MVCKWFVIILSWSEDDQAFIADVPGLPGCAADDLMQQAERKGVLVVRCNESYTSKTCPHCGEIHEKLGGNKVFKCPNCGYTAPRDWVGARNIMLRALQATAVVFQDNAILFQSA